MATLFRNGFGIATFLLILSGSLSSAHAANCVPATSALDRELLATVALGEPPSVPFDVRRFESLLAQGANVNAQDRACQSVLLFTVVSHAYMPEGHAEKPLLLAAARRLVNMGANVNLSDKLGLAPLMMAVHRAHMGNLHHHQGVPMIKPMYDILLSATAPAPDLNASVVEGPSILAYLAQWGERAEIERLVRLGARLDLPLGGGSNIVQAVVAGGADVPFLQWFLELFPAAARKPALENRNAAGSDSLISAVRIGRTEVVRHLVQTVGVSTRTQNLGDETALSAAILRRDAPRQPAATRARFAEIAAILEAGGATLPVVPAEGAIRCDGPNGGEGRFEQLRRIIETCGVRRVDDLLPLLPKAHLTNYVLSYAPRGLQDGSFLAPRVITEGKDGQVLISFNGDPRQEGYQAIEMIEFKDTPVARFELREIDFSSGRASYSESNPARCLTCHGTGGTEPRPLWDTWFIWPGFYRSEQAAFYPVEYGHYREYLATSRHQGRYANLLEYSDSPMPVLDDHIVNYINSEKMHRFDFAVDNLMARKQISDLANEPGLRPWRFALLGAVNCSDPVEGYIPADVAAARLPRSVANIKDELARLGAQEITRRIARQRVVLPGAPEGGYAEEYTNTPWPAGQNFDWDRVARLRYLLQAHSIPAKWSSIHEPAGVDSSIWRFMPWTEAGLWKRLLDSTNAVDRPIRARFETRYAATSYFADFKPQPLFRTSGGMGLPVEGSGAEVVCAELKQASLNALSGPTKR